MQNVHITHADLNKQIKRKQVRALGDGAVCKASLTDTHELVQLSYRYVCAHVMFECTVWGGPAERDQERSRKKETDMESGLEQSESDSDMESESEMDMEKVREFISVRCEKKLCAEK